MEYEAVDVKTVQWASVTFSYENYYVLTAKISCMLVFVITFEKLTTSYII
jgi:hypothetical protein